MRATNKGKETNKGKGKVEDLQEAGMNWKKEMAFGFGGAAGAPAEKKDGSRRKEGVAGRAIRARRKGKNGSFDLSF